MEPIGTKQHIIDTATNLFSGHGFSATSIDDILRGVGITKGAFYHYFRGKDHLCEVVLDCAVTEYHRLADDLQKQESHLSPLDQWCRMLIEKQTSGEWLYYRLLMRLSIESGELNAAMRNTLRTFWRWCQAFYETLVQKTIPTDTTSPAVDPPALARLYMAAHFGAAWLDRCAADSQDLTAVCETLLKLGLS